MLVYNRIFFRFIFVFSFIFIFSGIYSNSIERNNLNGEDVLSWKLKSFDAEFEDDETRYEKIKSRTFFEKVNSIMSKKNKFIPEVFNHSLLKRAIVDDFQVNDDNNIGTFFQISPGIDVNKYGMGVVCWVDDRNVDLDIFAQRYDSLGNLLGENFKVNDDGSSANQSDPEVCIFDDGSFVICWTDNRNRSDDPDIYAQRYDNSGEPIGNNFRVNNDNEGAQQSHPAIDGAEDGFFVICWEDRRFSPGIDQVYAQRFDTSGEPIKINFRVNELAPEAVPCEYPDVAVQDNHAFIICWEDRRYDEYCSIDIFMQIFDPDGERMGYDIDIIDEFEYFPQYRPKVSVNNDGYCVICWVDSRGEIEYQDKFVYDIYAQRLDINYGGGIIGYNFKANTDEIDTVIQVNPDVSVSDDTTFVISWVDYRNGAENPDIYLQTYDSHGKLADEDIKVNDDNSNVSQYLPAVGSADNQTFFVCWEDKRSGDYDIFFQRFKNNVPQDGNIKINDDRGANQSDPSISVSSEGSFVITWDDRRNGESNIDVFFQMYNPSAQAQGKNTIANDDTTKFFQTHSSVSFLNDTNFVVSWGDLRNGIDDPDIYFQIFKDTDERVGTNTRVNDDQLNAFQISPSVSSFNDGSFIICWSDDRNSRYDDDIYAQKFNSSGEPDGMNFRVNDDQNGMVSQFFPVVGVSLDGFYTICWQDMRLFLFDIYAQIFDNFSERVNSSFKVNDDEFSFCTHVQPDIDYASDGSFVICWTDRRNASDDPDIYAQRYDQNGVPIGNNFRVNDDQSGAAQGSPSVSTAYDGSFIICWEDRRNGSYNSDIYAQCYDRDGNPLKNNLKVNGDQTLRAQTEPDVDLDENNNIYFVWKDNRNQGSGSDIFAKILSWDFFTELSEEKISENIPGKFMLYQNYPNPLNPITTIKYDIQKEGMIMIKVYNINGVHIRTLVNKKQHPGVYSTIWNGENDFGISVASGLYLINMRAEDYSMTRKILLLK